MHSQGVLGDWRDLEKNSTALVLWGLVSVMTIAALQLAARCLASDNGISTNG